MRRSWLFLEPPLIPGARILSKEQSHYLLRVLRLRQDAELEVFDGQGRHARATLSGIQPKRCELQVDDLLDDRHGESPLDLTLAMVLARGQRMDQVLQKATELGVDRIQLLTSERCEVRLDGDRKNNRQAHWRAVAISAAEQCHRTCIPDILAPRELQEWLPESDGGWILDPHSKPADASRERELRSSLTILSGPEGGFSDAEVVAAQTHQFERVNLGPRVLRAETAPLAAITHAQWLYGDLASR